MSAPRTTLVLAAALVGFYPPLILATGEQLSEPLGAFFVTAGFAALALRKRYRFAVVAAGYSYRQLGNVKRESAQRLAELQQAVTTANDTANRADRKSPRHAKVHHGLGRQPLRAALLEQDPCVDLAR